MPTIIENMLTTLAAKDFTPVVILPPLPQVTELALVPPLVALTPLAILLPILLQTAAYAGEYR